MTKRAVFVLGLVSVSVLILASAWSQEDMTHVGRDDFTNPQRTASVFVHDEHNEAAGIEACNECHHLYEDGNKVEDESSEDQRCSDCHELNASGGQPALLKAFHTNCKGCHLEKAEGPILCGECHQRT